MRNNKPLVTIGIPAYNEEKYLAKTIKSVLNQSFQNIKIIVSDNCSTDNSYQIASEFAKKDDRIIIFRQPENRGVIENFKYPLRKCNTKYFMWMGAHDILLPTFIEEAVTTMTENPSVFLYYPKALFFENENELLGSADSDIDTRDLTRVDAMLKLANNLSTCTAIHGVFITNKLKKLPLNKNAADLLVLLLAAGYGNLVPSKTVQFQRRVIRKESLADQKKRFEKFGMIDNANADLHYLRSIIYYKYLFKLPAFSFKDKITLSINTRKIFCRRFFYFSWDSLLKYYFFSDLQPIALFYIFYLKFHLFFKKQT